MTKNTKPLKRPRGRPIGSLAAPETKKKRINISILPEHQAIAELAGDGNVSAGIGAALDKWSKKKSK